MPEKLENVKLKVAIGIGYGGCIVEILEGEDNIKIDAKEYGGSLDDFFYEGAEPPKEPGIYIFTGASHGIPGSDEFPRYHGAFELDNTSPEIEGTFPVVLYLGSEEDREELIQAVMEVKPNMKSRKL